jgi:hypothetical protein
MCAELNWPRIGSSVSVVLIDALMLMMLTDKFISDNLLVVNICWAHYFPCDEQSLLISSVEYICLPSWI